MLELTKGQIFARDDCYDWFRKGENQIYELVGYAGTGKSTVIGALIDRLALDPNSEVLYVAYTGQAALVLRMKGHHSSTIHSAIYEVKEVQKVDENGQPVYYMGRPAMTHEFVLKPVIDGNVKLIVVDEASMVPQTIKDDLMGFGIPIIALGDLGQLPPVIGNPAFLTNPNARLTEIMRQAEGSPIVELSRRAREGKHIDLGVYNEHVAVINKSDVTSDMLQSANTIICGKNKTRDSLNKLVREEIWGRTGILPVLGDKLICRKNNWKTSVADISLVNGLTGYVVNPVDLSSIQQGSFNIDFQPYFMKKDFFENIKVDMNYFRATAEERKEGYFPAYHGNKFEYGYAITGHLSQGGQYRDVVAYEETLSSNIHNKWLYTVITRAIRGLVLVKEERRRRRWW